MCVESENIMDTIICIRVQYKYMNCWAYKVLNEPKTERTVNKLIIILWICYMIGQFDCHWLCTINSFLFMNNLGFSYWIVRRYKFCVSFEFHDPTVFIVFFIEIYSLELLLLLYKWI